MSTDLRLNPSKCLSCHEPMTGATCVTGDHHPSPNDITICFYCGHIMVFDDAIKLREAYGRRAGRDNLELEHPGCPCLDQGEEEELKGAAPL